MKNNQNVPKKSKYLTQSEKLKKLYIDKISSYIMKRYNSFFKDKGYSQTHLNKDIEKLIHNKDMKTFDVNSEQPKIEKIIMEKISNMESTKVNILTMDSIKNLLPQKAPNSNGIPIPNQSANKNYVAPPSQSNPKRNFSKGKEPIQNRPNNNTTNKPNPITHTTRPTNYEDIPYNTEKVEKLKQKQNDKWALQVNQNYQEYLQEEENKKKQKEEAQRLHKEMLEQQIAENKRKRELLKQEEEKLNQNNRNYFGNHDTGKYERKEQITNLPSEEQNIFNGYNEYNNNISERNLKYRKEAEQENTRNMNQKNKKYAKENEQDLAYQKQMEDEIRKYKDEELKRKNEQREKYILMQKENEENAKRKMLEKQKIKEEKLRRNEMNYEYYSPPLPNPNPENRAGQQPPLNNNEIPTTNKMTNNNFNNEDFYEKIKEKEKQLKEYETKKLQREMEEIKQKEDEQILQQKLKKEKMLQEYQEGLLQQIKERNDRKAATQTKK